MGRLLEVVVMRWRRMVVLKIVETSIPNDVHFLSLDRRHVLARFVRRLCNYLNSSPILPKLMVAI